ncbi:hypothetical protein H8356DRAFT_1323025 [Neocallimastix lanati (nom. inval.)]|nr:hypothetical protein H8356DRAFT_1323025 [Neocallimastix sp. JGI-2020a]
MPKLTTGLSISDIRLSLDSLAYHFGIDVDLSLSKAKMKDISYTSSALSTSNYCLATGTLIIAIKHQLHL